MEKVCRNHPKSNADTICFHCKEAYCWKCVSEGGENVFCSKKECLKEKEKQKDSLDQTKTENDSKEIEAVIEGISNDGKIPFPKNLVSIGLPVSRKSFQIRILGLAAAGFFAFVAAELELVTRFGFLFLYIAIMTLVAIQAAKRQKARRKSPWWAITCFLNHWWAGVFLIYITLKKDGADELSIQNHKGGLM